MDTHAPLTDSPALPALSNAEIADWLASLAQLLSTQKENPYKVKAYQARRRLDQKPFREH